MFVVLLLFCIDIKIMGTKKILQDWLSGFEFSHMVTVEPTPPLPYRQNEIVQPRTKVRIPYRD